MSSKIEATLTLPPSFCKQIRLAFARFQSRNRITAFKYFMAVYEDVCMQH